MLFLAVAGQCFSVALHGPSVYVHLLLPLSLLPLSLPSPSSLPSHHLTWHCSFCLFSHLLRFPVCVLPTPSCVSHPVFHLGQNLSPSPPHEGKGDMVWSHPHLPSVWFGLVPLESFVFLGVGASWADFTGHRGSSLGWRNQVCKDLAWSRATGVPLALQSQTSPWLHPGAGGMLVY